MPEKQPAWLIPFLVLVSAFALLPASLVYYARATHSPVPRISIVPDMDTQQKYKTQAYNSLFADHRAMRLPPDGAVARDETGLDTRLQHGQAGGAWITTLPMTVTPELMRRGREQYGIYCAPCHGQLGYGNGPVDARASQLQEGTWVAPSNYHTALVRGRPVGHLYNTITNGIRNMPSYGAQISVEDRWAIVAYIRALQRSQNATLSDVPPGKRAELQRQATAEAATQPPPAGKAPGNAAASPGAGGAK